MVNGVFSSTSSSLLSLVCTCLINVGASSGLPFIFADIDFTGFNGKLFFRADDGVNGREVSVVDLLLRPLNQSPSPSSLSWALSGAPQYPEFV